MSLRHGFIYTNNLNTSSSLFYFSWMLFLINRGQSDYSTTNLGQNSISINGTKIVGTPWGLRLWGGGTRSSITYLQLWLICIYAVDKVQLCHKILAHMPRSVDAHCQGVQYLSTNSMEGGGEVSALI